MTPIVVFEWKGTGKMFTTPIVHVPLEGFENRIYVKRDDLIPFSFGGNKVRIAEEFLADMEIKGGNCMIGYGNARSNLSRALANLCCKKNIPCHIISPADDDGSRIETANSHLVKSCGVIFHECSKQNVAQTVDAVKETCGKQGFIPYYIYGDRFGKGNEAVPVRAYAKVYPEIRRQAQEMQVEFDYIFLATGTGMTQSGLLAGQSRYGGSERIVGVSVAREAEKESAVIAGFLSAYAADNGIENLRHTPILVTDAYLKGGYGEYDDAIRETIMQVFIMAGIPLDPTYTGKAFCGMREYLKKEKIQGKNILFLHTGGTPLFFDFLKKAETKPETEFNIKKEKLVTFLERIDAQLPTPLSSRVELNAYADKVIAHGRVLAVEEKDKIVSALLFYCNDREHQNAYITLLGTLAGHEGKGLGRRLMREMESVARQEGMKRVCLDTEKSNSRALAFYSRCGYVIEYVADKIHMVKELQK